MSDMNRPNGMQVPEEGYRVVNREAMDSDYNMRQILKELTGIRKELHQLTAVIEHAARKR